MRGAPKQMLRLGRGGARPLGAQHAGKAMGFDDIIGQQAVKERLISAAVEDKLPHALMLHGPEGNGGLALAVALAQYVLCQDRAGRPAEMSLFGPTEAVPPRRDCCGECLSCRMSKTLEHPDLHFIFPVARKGSKPMHCDDLLTAWRKWLLDDPYGGYPEWLEITKAEKQQLLIYTDESDIISGKLALKSGQGGWRVCIIWLPEKMHIACANKMLKLLEEPPSQTLFLLVSQQPELVVETVRSRTQPVHVPPLSADSIERFLVEKHAILPAEAARIAHNATGNMAAALRAIRVESDGDQLLETFINIMRHCYARRVKEMRQWSEDMAARGREPQLRFLTYALYMLRENFAYNLRLPHLTHMRQPEQDFATKFAPFINERNIIPLRQLFERAYTDIAQNANPKILFFDLALRTTVLIRQPRA